MDSVTMNHDYMTILNRLQKHHALFSEFWSVGRIVESEKIQTAAIEFDNTGDGIQFLVCPSFWNGLDDNEKTFVIAHECLHVYFEHGRRFHALAKTHTRYSKQELFGIANRAGDVVINHYLVDAFGFKRDELKFESLGEITTPEGKVIKGADILCWVDTVFPNKKVDRRRSMEYYFNLLLQEQEKNGGGGEGGGKTLDDHDYFTNGSGGDSDDKSSAQKHADRIRDLVDDLVERISDDELKDFEDKVAKHSNEETTEAQQAGNMGGNLIKRIRLGRVIKKKKWETVIQDVLGRFKGKERDITIEQWARHNRRVNMLEGDLLLPSELDEVMPIRDRIDVWFFQDTSGSCVEYAERFFKAAASIPEDRFKIRGFCFDTQTFEVDFKKGELQGFGGTCFRCIENRIQDIVKNEKCLYPQAVFVITDGYGSNVTPEFPERWHWFLTAGGSEYCIPKQSHIYKLSDFE